MPQLRQRIQETLARALVLIDEAAGTRDRRSEGHQLLLWKIAAEAEYAAFMISLESGLGEFDPPVAPTNGERVAEEPEDSARMLLRDAQSLLPNEPREAYRKVRLTVRMMRQAYSILTKPASQKESNYSGSGQSPKNA